MRLRTAQQAYVAEGQGPTTGWRSRPSAVDVDRGLAALAADASGEATRSAIQAASGALEDFRKLDVRSRGYVKGRQALMASDVIFTESLGDGRDRGRARGGGPRQRGLAHDSAISTGCGGVSSMPRPVPRARPADRRAVAGAGARA